MDAEDIKIEILKDVMEALFVKSNAYLNQYIIEKNKELKGIAIGYKRAEETVNKIFEKLTGMSYEEYLIQEEELYADEDEEAIERARQRDRERRAESDRQLHEDFLE